LKVTDIWMALQKVKQNSVISYTNGIDVPKVFTIARRTGLYINHIHIHQRSWLISLLYTAPLHIKLGLMKNSIKTLDRNGPAFSFLCEKFPKHRRKKIKVGIFFGPQIRWLFKEP
jgi:hypothetical protein